MVANCPPKHRYSHLAQIIYTNKTTSSKKTVTQCWHSGENLVLWAELLRETHFGCCFNKSWVVVVCCFPSAKTVQQQWISWLLYPFSCTCAKVCCIYLFLHWICSRSTHYNQFWLYNLDALCYKPEIMEHKRTKVPISIRTENHRILTKSGQSSNER